MDAHDLNALRSFLESDLGLNLNEVILESVVRHVHDRQPEFESFDQFASAVAASVAVPETYFLRHREQFEWIEQIWLPQRLARCRIGDTVRIFSGGCATGEEPYSLYAHLAPRFAEHGVALAVDAVDVSAQALAKARQGRYGLWSLRGVTVESEQDWLSVESRNVQVKPWVQEGVTFCLHNLLKPFGADHAYDLILCRNVMIYMHGQAISQTLTNLRTLLKPDGFILPGPSDPNPPADIPLAVHWLDGLRVFTHDAFSLQPAVSTSISTSQPAPTSRPACTSSSSEPAMQVITAPAGDVWTDMQVIETCVRESRYDQARAMLEANIRLQPLDVRSHIMLCMLALDLDDLLLAEEAARHAAYIEPHALFTVYLIGIVKLRQGNRESATGEFMWVWHQLRQLEDHQAMKYCEDITVGEFKGVVRARLD